MENNKYRLCYAMEHILCFTDNFENQWGDDWNDPYHSSGMPNEYDEAYSKHYNRSSGHLRYIAFLETHGCFEYPWERDAHISVEEINKGWMPWLADYDAGGLPGGATIEEAVEYLRKAKALFAELKSDVGDTNGT